MNENLGAGGSWSTKFKENLSGLGMLFSNFTALSGSWSFTILAHATGVSASDCGMSAKALLYDSRICGRCFLSSSVMRGVG